MQNLINLSNHPLQSWSDEQLCAARKQFAEIIDYPFPAVNPHLDSEQLYPMAGTLVYELKEKYPAEQFALHIMGEQTMSFLLIQLLMTAGYRCLSSTSDRLVDVKEGHKIVRFQFQRFRDYQLL